MKPTLNDTTIVDPVLTNVALAYNNFDYVAEKVAPVIKVKKQTGKYYVFDKSKFRKIQTERAIGAPAKETGYGLSSSAAFTCKDHALKEMVPDEEKLQSDSPLTPEADATENVMERLSIEKEYNLANYMQDTANLTNNTTLSGSDQWSDYQSSDPIDDIETGIESVRSNSIVNPNTFLVGQQVWNKLKHHPDAIERIKYSGFAKFTGAALADLLDLQNVIVASARYNSANEGQSDSLSYIWGKYAWVLYITNRPGIKKPSFMYHMQWQRETDKWYDKDRKGMWVRVHDNYTRETVTVNAAYLIKNAVA